MSLASQPRKRLLQRTNPLSKLLPECDTHPFHSPSLAKRSHTPKPVFRRWEYSFWSIEIWSVTYSCCKYIESIFFYWVSRDSIYQGKCKLSFYDSCLVLQSLEYSITAPKKTHIIKMTKVFFCLPELGYQITTWIHSSTNLHKFIYCLSNSLIDQ